MIPATTWTDRQALRTLRDLLDEGFTPRGGSVIGHDGLRRTADQLSAKPDKPRTGKAAVKWGIKAAAEKAAGYHQIDPADLLAIVTLAGLGGRSIVEWCSWPGRLKGEVVDVLDAAIKACGEAKEGP